MTVRAVLCGIVVIAAIVLFGLEDPALPDCPERPAAQTSCAP